MVTFSPLANSRSCLQRGRDHSGQRTGESVRPCLCRDTWAVSWGSRSTQLQLSHNELMRRASHIFPWPSELASESGSHLATVSTHSSCYTLLLREMLLRMKTFPGHLLSLGTSCPWALPVPDDISFCLSCWAALEGPWPPCPEGWGHAELGNHASQEAFCPHTGEVTI